MAEKKTKSIAFPIFNHYNLPIKFFVEQGLGQNYIMQPQMTRRTLELGARYSPDSICTPFKHTLGSEIEALEAGADTLVMTMGLCRLGYYGELQEDILRELGYEFDFLNFSEYATGNYRDYLKALKRLSPRRKAAHMASIGLAALKMVEYIDEIEEEYYHVCGFELKKGACRQAFQKFLFGMRHAKTKKDIDQAYREAKHFFQNVPLRQDNLKLRVGVIGEYFTVMDGFSNLYIEQTLADMGVYVDRWMNLTHRNIHYPGEKNLNPRIRDLCTYEMGPTSTANIWCARNYAEQGYDGIVHVKSATCTPEIDIMPVLQNIGQDYHIPILYLTYDTQTSDTGLQTRLEAFYDMISMRKKVFGNAAY